MNWRADAHSIRGDDTRFRVLSSDLRRQNIPPVNLLWTGGWDSTFRLIDLVLRRGRAVAPHYLVNPDRPGTVQELRAMREIRKQIDRRRREAGELILPTKVVLLDSIAPNAAISEKFSRLRSRSYLGVQYDWFARFTAQDKITNLELCIHADDRAEAFVRDHVEHEISEDGEAGWRLRSEYGSDDLGIFANFRFPLLNLTKSEMRRASEADGFQEIMALTWFCHTPIDGCPCGVCNPCRYTIAEGMSDRLPARALLRNRFAPQYRAAKRIGSFIDRKIERLAKRFLCSVRRR
jgi:hypothetical protein